MLAVIGVAIGICGVIVVVAISHGVKNQIKSEIQNFGSNLIGILPGKVSANSISPISLVANSNLTYSDAEDLRNVTEIEDVAPIIIFSGTIKYKDNKVQVAGIGTTSDIGVAKVYNIEEGKNLSAYSKDSKVIEIGTNISKQIFGNDDPVGKKVMLNGNEYTVTALFSGISVSSMGVDVADMIVIPIDSAITLLNTDKLGRILIKIRDDADIDQVKDQIKNRIITRHDGVEDFSIFTQEEIISTMDSIMSKLSLLIIVVASVALVVGGLGISNIMYISVSDRIPEMGIRKAIGASEAVIFFQFLFERY
jgi:putative ABC transport system permease protein